MFATVADCGRTQHVSSIKRQVCYGHSSLTKSLLDMMNSVQISTIQHLFTHGGQRSCQMPAHTNDYKYIPYCNVYTLAVTSIYPIIKYTPYYNEYPLSQEEKSLVSVCGTLRYM